MTIFTWLMRDPMERPLSTSFRNALLLICLSTFTGCFSQTSIKKVSIVDPQVGVTLEVPVKSDGSFAHETKKENVVALTSGKISDAEDGFHNVKFVYERKSNGENGGERTDKLETEFQAKVDTEVPIGRKPSESPNVTTDAGNVFADLTIKLSKD